MMNNIARVIMCLTIFSIEAINMKAVAWGSFVLPDDVAAPGLGFEYARVCPTWHDYLDAKKCRRTLCDELDSYGGQPVVAGKLAKLSDQWITENFSELPKGYLKTLPKRGLPQDRVMKERQERYWDFVEEIRKNVRYAYAQTEALHLSRAKFDILKQKYKRLIASRAWKDIGSSYTNVQEKSHKTLVKLIDELHLVNVDIFDDVLAAKQQVFSTLASEHPEVVQSVRTKQQIAIMERKVRNAERRASAAEQRAAEAENAASSAAFEAQEAGRRANNAEREARLLRGF